MLYFDGLLGLVLLGLWLYCLIDLITTDAGRCRNLPKLAWLVIVLVLPDIGSIAWLVAGHPWQSQPGSDRPRTADTPRTADRHHAACRQPPTNPDDDEAFLRGLRERAEQQRRTYREGHPQERAEQEPRRPEQPGQDD